MMHKEIARENIHEEALTHVSGGALTLSELAHVTKVAQGKAPTVRSRTIQATVGTALGFGAFTGGDKAAKKAFKKNSS
jgi:hypothetical protein